MTCNGREEVNLDLEESSELESSLVLNEECNVPQGPQLLSNIPSNYWEDENIGTINDETENSVDDVVEQLVPVRSVPVSSKCGLEAQKSCPISSQVE